MGSYATNPQMHPGTSLEGRVALITGAGRGLGAGLARELASRGASVVLNYARSAKAALAVVADIESEGGSAIAIQADISKPSEVTRLFDAAIAHFARLDIVINNAGMESFANEEDVTEKMFDEVFGLNTRAQFFVAQHGLKHLTREFPPAPLLYPFITPNLPTPSSPNRVNMPSPFLQAAAASSSCPRSPRT